MEENALDSSTDNSALVSELRETIRNQEIKIEAQNFQIDILEERVQNYKLQRDALLRQLEEIKERFLSEDAEIDGRARNAASPSRESEKTPSKLHTPALHLGSEPSTPVSGHTEKDTGSPLSAEVKRVRSLKREKSIKQRREDDVLIKRSRAYSSAYELSADLQRKQVEMLEKKYGGRRKSGRAAKIIQQAFRQYSMSRNFEKIRSAKSENRMSRRYTTIKARPEWEKMFSKCVVSLDFEPGESTDEDPTNKTIDLGEVAFLARHIDQIQDNRKSDIVCHVDIPENADTSLSAVSPSSESSQDGDEASNRQVGPVDKVTIPSSNPTGLSSEVKGADPDADPLAVLEDVVTASYSQEEDVPLDTVTMDTDDKKAGSTESDPKKGSTVVVTVLLKDGAGEKRTVTMSPGDTATTDMSRSISKGEQHVSPEKDNIQVQQKTTDSKVPEVVVATPEGTKSVIDDKVSKERTIVSPTTKKEQDPLQRKIDHRKSREHDDFMRPQKAVVRVLGSQEPVGSPVWRRKMLDSSVPASMAAASSVGAVNSTGSSGTASNRSSICSISSTTTTVSTRSDISSSSGSSGGVEKSKVANGIAKPIDLEKYESCESLSTDGSCLSINATSDSFQGSSDSISLTSENISVSEVEAVHGKKDSPAPSVSNLNIAPLTDERKRRYRIGLNLFNKKPEKGLKLLIENKFLDNSPMSVAKFLLTAKGVSKQMTGEYLGNLQNRFNMEVLEYFVDHIDLAGLPLDEALRKFQTYYRMPGEAQKIERLMEAFGQRYCMCNPKVVSKFRNPDTVFILAFAIIMLNTDQHNPNIKPERRMKLEDFLRNLRGIDNGEDVDRDYLVGIYDRVRRREFQPGVDHVTQVRKLDQSIVGHKPILAEAHRRLVCYVRLFEVYDPTKREKPHQREVFLFNDVLVVTKILTRRKTSITYNYKKSYPINGVTVLLFETPSYQYGIRLITVVDNKILITFTAQSEEDRNRFVTDLRECILEVNEMEEIRIGAELEKQTLTLKRSLGSAADSGVGLDTDSIINGDLRDSMDSLTVHSKDNSLKRTALSNSLMDLKESAVVVQKTSTLPHRRSPSSLPSATLTVTSANRLCVYPRQRRGKKGRRDSSGSLDSGMYSRNPHMTREARFLFAR
ncbi:IQ motif and SEC7 domain-containing protein 1-like isoform X4 [Ptychodera flava]